MALKKLLLLAAWIAVPPVILLAIKGNFLLSCILYLIIPAIYFSWQKPEGIPRALVAAVSIVPPLIILDYIAFVNKTWFVPSIFHFRAFTYIPFEDFVFTIFSVYTIVLAFSYFFPSVSRTAISKNRLIKSALALIALFAIFLCFYILSPELQVPYYYVWLTLVFMIPAGLLLKGYPQYRRPVLWSILCSFLLMLPYEIVANMLKFWTFPGTQYIGMIHILGQSFPIEEFIIWMILFVPATLGFSKFMNDPE